NIDLKNPIHPRERDHHPARPGNSAPAQAGTRPAPHNRNVMRARQFDQLDHILRAAREDNQLGLRFVYPTVVFIQLQVGRLGQNGLRAQLRLRCRHYRRINRHVRMFYNRLCTYWVISSLTQSSASANFRITRPSLMMYVSGYWKVPYFALMSALGSRAVSKDT